mmetsp:Transcript_2140/g.4363  ORF Transcript_2140/g.4363 Transcript_2140/m.4363 type:complete len:206 (+) Transcript_2140:131-748(+)
MHPKSTRRRYWHSGGPWRLWTTGMSWYPACTSTWPAPSWSLEIMWGQERAWLQVSGSRWRKWGTERGHSPSSLGGPLLSPRSLRGKGLPKLESRSKRGLKWLRSLLIGRGGRERVWTNRRWWWHSATCRLQISPSLPSETPSLVCRHLISTSTITGSTTFPCRKQLQGCGVQLPPPSCMLGKVLIRDGGKLRRRLREVMGGRARR